MFNIFTYIKRLDEDETRSEQQNINQYKHLVRLRAREELATNYKKRVKKFIFQVI